MILSFSLFPHPPFALSFDPIPPPLLQCPPLPLSTLLRLLMPSSPVPPPDADLDAALHRLEHRVADLIKLTEHIRHENQLLQNDHRILRQQFRALQDKNRIAHSRLKQIISRLKSL